MSNVFQQGQQRWLLNTITENITSIGTWNTEKVGKKIGAAYSLLQMIRFLAYCQKKKIE